MGIFHFFVFSLYRWFLRERLNRVGSIIQVNGIVVLPKKSIIEPKFGIDKATNTMTAKSPVRTTIRCQHISMKLFSENLDLRLKFSRCKRKSVSSLPLNPTKANKNFRLSADILYRISLVSLVLVVKFQRSNIFRREENELCGT